ncbi:small ubiquitin-related modifier 3-like [Chenopodium quinoa]|uniref:Rad60/SUMO-like domain-containing protein n=1 Tax=Chenopodium quinoa TaxID=63459 RepID=A0A803L4E1_CHEQI|nr:small ubiquitin-related modifier 3-like [Chenopodium quinoa]
MAMPPIQRINQDSATKVKLESAKNLVTLKVQAGDDHDVIYRVKRDFPLYHMKLVYCDRLGLEYGVVRFVYGKAEVPGAKTPDDLMMKNGCTIDTWVDKFGG